MSEGFSADWLTLREPYDTRAVARGPLERLAEWSGSRSRLRVVDLGSGTGSNLRRTAPSLAPGQTWTLVEWDPALIAAGSARLAGAPVTWNYRRLDLASDLALVADRPCDLMTASALLDLVSAAWLDELEALRGRLGAALYVSLSYVGGVHWSPADPMDAVAQDLVDRHQRIDKGFGPALGPTAVRALRARLPADRVLVEFSPWRLGPDDREIQDELLGGYVVAASVLAPDAEAELAGWGERRRDLIRRGLSHLEVGHEDLLFVPD